MKLKDKNFKDVDVSLKNNIIQFYGQCNTNIAAMVGQQHWREITAALDKLDTLQVNR